MVDEGLLISAGNTQDRRHSLVERLLNEMTIEITERIEEDVVWAQLMAGVQEAIPDAVKDVAFYGFTEMVNNVKDHSAGTTLDVRIARTARSVVMTVRDDGVGIFQKIARECNLDDQRHAIFELVKGKLTTDQERHTGEGIFFTSRACDVFLLTSGNLSLVWLGGKDWLLEDDEEVPTGTSVRMTIRLDTKKTMAQVFRKYEADEEPTFSKTIVPVSLAGVGDENLVSRSQAKRLLARVERFSEVVLDFKGVKEIGQAFADEVFRVFQRQHPQMKISAIRANTTVRRMIDRALATAAEQK